MSMTIVRIDEQRLGGMMRRLNSLLTDEGAKAWYATDVADLIQEVVLLRQELEDARDYLRTDLQHVTWSPTDSFPSMVEQWKEQATGVYEKATVKKLRAEANELRLIDQQQRAIIENLSDEASQAKEALIAAQVEWQNKERTLRQDIAAAVTHSGTLRERITELEGHLAICSEARAEDQRLRQEALMSAAMSHEEIKSEVRQILSTALERLA